MLEINIKRALDGFDLDVEFSVDKEILSILGPSGSGKTMTLLCIAGLIKPDEGYIKLNGRVLFDSSQKICLPAQIRKIGFVFQNYALFPHLTVEENIAYGIRHLPKQVIKDRVTQLLGTIHISGLGHRYPVELSSGQQQRVALARAIAPEPEVLLLDEPFSALDTPRKERLEYELLSLHQFYKGDVLFVTHDLAQGYKLSSRLAIYDSGRMVQLDSKQEVISFPGNRTVARLIGVKNILEGRVVKIDGKDAWVSVPELAEPLKVASGKTMNVSTGQQVIIGIRPEYIRLADSQKENIIPCKVNQIVEGVASVQCHLHADSDEVGKYRFEVHLPATMLHAVSEGRPCYLYLPPERLVIVPE